MATENSEPHPPEAVIEGHVPSSAEIFFEKNSKAIIALVLVAVLAVFAYILFTSVNQNKALAASEAFAAATTIEEYTRVSVDHQGTTAAGSALLMKAELEHVEDKRKESLATLTTFVTSYPDHPRHVQGLFAMGVQSEDSGDLAAANSYYEKVISNENGADLAPLALIRQGDLAFSRGEYDKARSIYQSVMPKYPGNAFYFKVQQMMALVNLKSPPAPAQAASDPVKIEAAPASPETPEPQPQPKEEPPAKPELPEAAATKDASETAKEDAVPAGENAAPKPGGDKDNEAPATDAPPAPKAFSDPIPVQPQE